MPEALWKSQVDNNGEAGQDIADETGENSGSQDGVELFQTKDVYSSGNAERAGCEGNPAKYIKANPQTPTTSIRETSGCAQSKDPAVNNQNKSENRNPGHD